ncbi:MAG: response regulator transcription factor [Sulfurospirillum sp.]|nr:response regulator transcription factor [Sulfurospirillum sp.]
MRIMLIEDDLDMQELLRDFLANYDYEVSPFAKPLEALQELRKENHYDIVVLDLMLPQIDGFDVCKKIRQMSNIPIIISSARGNLGDKVVAFEYGADDYLAKPYEPKELVIRINAIIKRVYNAPSKKEVSGFVIDEHLMQIVFDGHNLELTPIEFKIFYFLLQNPKKVLSRQAIAQSFGIELSGEKDRTIDMHISNIRSKIFDDSKSAKYIKSVWGMGYQFIG